LKNGKIYVGKTSKLPAGKVAEHNKGTDHWSKLKSPFTLIYYESYFCKEDTTNREKFYKSGFGRTIKKLIIQTLGG
jgi:predicted GIY-YIG superfamily endonuclease